MEATHTLSSLRKIMDIVIQGEGSFCCLCFNIGENYNLTDKLSIEISEKAIQVQVNDIVQSVFGKKIQEYLSTFEKVCEECLKTVVGVHTFIQTCQENITLLTKALNGLNESITYAEDVSDESKSLFVTLQFDDFTSKHFYDTEKNESRKTAIDRFKILNATKSKKSKQTETNDAEHNIKVSEMVLDPNNPVIKCKVCLKLFPVMWKLRLHYLKVHAPKIYKCPKCSNAYSTKNLCTYHMTENHSKCVCKTCGKTFKSRTAQAKHEKAHNLKLVCTDCGRTYKSKETYKKHLELNVCKQECRANPADAQFTCDYCGKKYTQKMSLRVHIQYEHGNYKAHTCKWCSKKFWAKSRLKAHIVKHTRERKFNCSHCEKKFVTKESLLYHTRLHTGDKPYKCSECGCGFISASRRAYHLKKYHFEGTIECDICHCKFTSQIYLDKHKKVHNESTGLEIKSKLRKRRKVPDDTLNAEKDTEAELNKAQKQSKCKMSKKTDLIEEGKNLDGQFLTPEIHVEKVKVQDHELNEDEDSKHSHNYIYLERDASNNIFVLTTSENEFIA